MKIDFKKILSDAKTSKDIKEVESNTDEYTDFKEIKSLEETKKLIESGDLNQISLQNQAAIIKMINHLNTYLKYYNQINTEMIKTINKINSSVAGNQDRQKTWKFEIERDEDGFISNVIAKEI